MDWCVDNGVSRMDWPAQIPDFNLIWDELDSRINGCNNRPKLVKELTCFLQVAWKNILLAVLQGLVESVPRRVAVVIASLGRSIDY